MLFLEITFRISHQTVHFYFSRVNAIANADKNMIITLCGHKIPSSLKESVTATRPTSQTAPAKIKKVILLFTTLPHVSGRGAAIRLF